METVKPKPEMTAQAQGRNFSAKLELHKDGLVINATEYVKGSLYTTHLTNDVIQKGFRRYLIFKTAHDIFDQLLINQHLRISDEQSLLVPAEVTYRGKIYELSIDIPLTLKKFNNEEEKIKSLFDQIQQLNNKIKMQKILLPQPIFMRKDCTNERHVMFQVTNGREVKMLGANQEHIFHHCEVLPKQGVFYFQLKVLSTNSKYIFMGICGKNIRTNISAAAYDSPYFMGFYLYNGTLYGNNKSPTVAPNLNVVIGETVFKVEIDMNRKEIAWYGSGVKLYSTEITKQIVDTDIYPMFTLYSNGDTVELVTQ